ncbi:MAG: 1-deoxy-D-xylulose-5-phosphate synthase [bacterium]
MTDSLIEKVGNPSDLKKLNIEDLPQLCDEIRNYIIEQLAIHPGHLGANLGVVELTVALHYVFNTPYDRLIWDVGHQAYTHKILTGRREAFKTNRQFKGISGFPSPKESEFDAFGVGHSSTSISAALGMSIAAHLKGENDRQVVAVIGDGSLTGGLALEGLNNVSTSPNNLLVVLNDNNMAIDPIKGGLSSYLTSIHFSPTYNRIRYVAYKGLVKMRLLSAKSKSKFIRFANSLKSFRWGAAQNNIFEGLNIRYFGPVDGHDVSQLVQILSELKHHNGPKVLHIITKKGKGYEPAENAVTTWHAPGEFIAATGERIKNEKKNEPPKFQDVFGHTLVELAEKNKNIVGITPAMPSGCSMTFMMDKMPERTFDVGIAEGHAVTFSAGLAKEGMMPFCNIYSSFMQRAYDNVIHDVALQKLNVVLCLDRAGLVGDDGATHQGQFDIAMFRPIPHLTIAVPRNEHKLRNLMYTAQLPDKGPFVIRYPRGKGVIYDWRNEMQEMEIGRGQCMNEGADIAIVGVGPILYNAKRAIELVAEENNSINIGLYDLCFVKPLDNDLITEISEKYKTIITIEDGAVIGGVGSAVEEWLMERNKTNRVVKLGLPDEFIEHGSPSKLFNMLSLDVEGIKNTILKEIAK